jgi:hypothetical protein
VYNSKNVNLRNKLGDANENTSPNSSKKLILYVSNGYIINLSKFLLIHSFLMVRELIELLFKY